MNFKTEDENTSVFDIKMESEYNFKEILRIEDPPQYGVIFEGKDHIKSSIFRSVYVEAAKNVSDIISSNSNPKEEMFNTVIAFVGRRGSGKSTAMYTFSRLLNDGFASKIITESKEKLDNTQFHVLAPIDSAQLGIKETIIGRISAAMYEEFEKVIKAPGCTLSTEKKRDFVKKISEVNQYAVLYQTGEWFKRDESLLNDTYRISMLRKSMEELVHSYLKIVSGKEKIDNDYLVVSIDDLDMGIKNSYTVMEEIRKFLCIKKTIVLITLRMDQIHLSLKEEFKEQLNNKKIDEEDLMLIDDLAYRYAEKFIPYDRQHQMPMLSSKQLKTWQADFAGIAFSSLEGKYPSIRDSVLNLIWEKTRIILIPNKDEEHLLIPHNLRSLCNLVVFLRGMKDVGDEENIDTQTLSNNINEFSQYLVNNIGTFELVHVSADDRQLASLLVKIIHNLNDIPLRRINSHIVGEILYYLKQSVFAGKENYYYSIFDWYRDEKGIIVYGNKKGKNELTVLLDACMKPECISIGDLMYVLGKIDSKTRCRYIKYLVEVIRTLWSAKMTAEYYVNKYNNNYLQKKDDYQIAIGSMIINPDVGFWDNNYVDFEGYEDQNNGDNTVFGVYCSTTKTPKTVEKTRTKPKFKDFDSWRRKWEKGRAMKKGIIWLHPFKLFTSDSVIFNFPFYSFDFIYRFYEELHKELSPVKNYEDKKNAIFGYLSSITLGKNLKSCQKIRTLCNTISQMKEAFNTNNTDYFLDQVNMAETPIQLKKIVGEMIEKKAFSKTISQLDQLYQSIDTMSLDESKKKISELMKQ